MECPPSTPVERVEPAYLNLPGWRCVPVFAVPTSCRTPSSSQGSIPSVEPRFLLPSNIPRDPRQWSRQNVYSWLEWCVDNFSLPSIDVDMFYMNGRGLCLLKKQDIQDRAPRCGDVLFNALQALMHKSNEGNNNFDGNISAENISSSLLQAAGAQDTAHSQILPPHHIWPRSISSDFHSVGHVVHENEHVNGMSTSHMNGSDVDSTTAPSPTPSHEGVATTPRDALSPNKSSGRQENGSNEKVTKFVTKPQITRYEGSEENGTEKINVRLLWDFLQQLLNDVHQRYNCCIMWKDKPRGVFKITDPHRLAGLWGKQKNHLNMNFDKMSRALRYYYRVRILQKEPGERHCYRFLRHPSELRHCKQRSLLTRGTGPNGNISASLECSDIEAVLDMSIKEENSPPAVTMND